MNLNNTNPIFASPNKLNFKNMKILFVNESIVFQDESGKYYARYGSSLGVWGDFYKTYDIDCIWMCRFGGKIDNTIGYIELSHKNFILVPNYTKNPILSTFKIIKKIARTTKKVDFALVSLPGYLSSLFLLSNLFIRIKYAINLVGDPLTAYNNKSFLGFILSLIFKILTNLLVFFARNVYYVSREFLQKKYPTLGNKFYIPDVKISNIIDLNVIENRLNRIRKISDTIIVGLIGSLDVNYRGHKTLLMAIKFLEKSTNFKIKIRFLGPGNSLRWIRYSTNIKISSEIFYDGVLPSGDSVLKWLDSIDILAMPTQQETMGRAIIEAMSRGCLVLGSNNTAIKEQISHENLFFSDDYQKLSQLIINSINNKDFMILSAYENFYRSYKYSYSQIEKSILNAFKASI